MDTCGISTNDIHITGYSGKYHECLRLDYHEGPHLIRIANGNFIAYQINTECECCSHLSSLNSDDFCKVYRQVSPIDAQSLIASKEARYEM